MSWEREGDIYIEGECTDTITSWVNKDKQKIVYVWFSGLSYKLRIFEWDYPDDLYDDSDSFSNYIREKLNLKKQISKERTVGEIVEVYQAPEDIPAPEDVKPFEYGVKRVKELYNINQ